MDFNDYQKWAASTSALREYDVRSMDVDTRVYLGGSVPVIPDGVTFVRIDHAAAGIASESGELMEHVKHVRFASKALDRDYLIKEAGDLLWYLAELATGLGVSLEHIAEQNIEKLKKRYPEGHFTVARSENREE